MSFKNYIICLVDNTKSKIYINNIFKNKLVDDYSIIKIKENIFLGTTINSRWTQKKEYNDCVIIIVGNPILENRNKQVNILDEIYKLFKKNGTKIFNKLSGNYNLSIIDKNKKRIYLSKDKNGTLPLYYNEYKTDVFSFSNCLKDLSTLNECNEINYQMVSEYLLYRYVANDETLIKDVRQVPKGHYIEYDYENYNLKIESLGSHVSVADKKKYKFDDAVDELDTLIECSVKNYIESFENNDILLSGGLDSAYIAWKLRKYYNGKIKAYTVGYKDNDYDESYYAKIIRKKYGFEHINHYVEEEEYFENFIKTIRDNEEPLNHPHTVSLNIICNIAKNNGTDSLFTGEGADSFLGTSPNLAFLKISNSPDIVKKALKNILILSEKFMNRETVCEKIKKIQNIITKTEEEIFLSASRYGDMKHLREICKNDSMYESINKRLQLIDKYKQKDKTNSYLMYTQNTSLISSLNMFGKITLNNDIVYKTPFLDYRLVHFLNKLNGKYKYRNFTGKYILKKAMEREFKKQYIYRKKYGFGAPLEKWIINKTYLGKYIDILYDQKTLERGIYQKNALKKLLDLYVNGALRNEYYEGLIWTMINLELWIRLFIEKKD